ncbi:hypothetical protein K440DRAFT_665046 [Wilcoxina mikolae CBS 423.85]|nr:hypothetical protein K440DRAFT_665046 [Wilcoxina mikolae CBS 423.85]
MSDPIFAHTLLLSNCSILFPPPTVPKILTVSEGGKRRIFIVCAATGRLLLEHEGTSHLDFYKFLSRTEDMLLKHVVALRRGNPLPVGKNTAVDEKVQKLEAESAKLRLEKEELQRRLDKSYELQAEALRVTQTQMERLWKTATVVPTEYSDSDTETQIATPGPSCAASEYGG